MTETVENMTTYDHNVKLKNLQTQADHLEFLRHFLTVTPEDFNTDFFSSYGVANAIATSPTVNIWVAYKDGKPRGFLIHDNRNRIHTMFTLPCTPENKVPSLFKEMLLNMADNVPRVVSSRRPVFLNLGEYNEEMIRWFTGSASHAELEYSVDVAQQCH